MSPHKHPVLGGTGAQGRACSMLTVLPCHHTHTHMHRHVHTRTYMYSQMHVQTHINTHVYTYLPSHIGLPTWFRWSRICLSMQETQVRSLGREDPPEKGMATLSSIPAWRIAWREEAGGLQSMGSHTSVCVYIYIHTYIYLVTCISYNLLKNNLNIYLFI